MSSAVIKNLFNFRRSLPSPFTGMDRKVKSASSFGASEESTLCSTVIKGLHAVCACMNRTGDGAVGTQDGKNIAEYKSSIGDEYHLIVHEPLTGALSAIVYDKESGLMQPYIVNDKNKDGAAIIMALFPSLKEESEFASTFSAYFAEYLKNFPDVEIARNLMGILCDNVYRRIQNDKIPEHINLDIDAAGNLLPISKVHLESGVYEPQVVEAGEFSIFAQSKGGVKVKSAKKIMGVEELAGKYAFSKRTFSASEVALIPKIPEWYIIPQSVIDVCNHANKTTGKSIQMRNFLLRGPAGTGKTMAAQAIAAGLGLPYMKYTCSANTEIFDFTGQIIPDTDGNSTQDPVVQKELDELKAMGGITYENVAKLLNLPDVEELDWDAAGVYKQLTGQDKEDATSKECIELVMDKVITKMQELLSASGGKTQGQSFKYVETDFLKALKYGYVVEVQEPTTIMQPGVLVGLNSLLEQKGSITLPTGEVIERHPDTVIVVTTNISYEGCRALNQSIVDRMSMVCDIELPSPEVMVQRAMSVTGETDETLVSEMVEVTNNMARYCKENSIMDGCVGMRSLIDWIYSTQVTGNVYESALYTILSKATSDEQDREAIKASVLAPIFSSRKARGFAAA